MVERLAGNTRGEGGHAYDPITGQVKCGLVNAEPMPRRRCSGWVPTK